jgi:hypothetical protein
MAQLYLPATVEYYIPVEKLSCPSYIPISPFNATSQKEKFFYFS